MKTNNKTIFVTGGSGFVGRNLIPFLVQRGYIVKALARSEKSVKMVEELGAIPIKGNLKHIETIRDELRGCASVFHLAASVDFFASVETLRELHVVATEKLLRLSKEEGISNFIYLGAASVAMNGKPLRNIDEGFVPQKFTDGYSQTKFEAEQLVLAASQSGFRTIALRPPLIWGKDDPNTLPAIIDAIKSGQMMLINGGKHHFVTCHVLNVCEALFKADNTKASGKSYFITDLENPVFKDFMAKYVNTKGFKLPKTTVPLWMARFFAYSFEIVWKAFNLKGQPPLYRGLVNVLGLEFTVDCTNAIDDLAYKPIISIAQGIKAMKYTV